MANAVKVKAQDVIDKMRQLVDQKYNPDNRVAVLDIWQFVDYNSILDMLNDIVLYEAMPECANALVQADDQLLTDETILTVIRSDSRILGNWENEHTRAYAVWTTEKLQHLLKQEWN